MYKNKRNKKEKKERPLIIFFSRQNIFDCLKKIKVGIPTYYHIV